MKDKSLQIKDTEIFQFTEPKFSLGQKVESEDGFTGYVVGLDFYPDTNTWSYGVYIVDGRNEQIEEIWYEAEQLDAIDLEFQSLEDGREAEFKDDSQETVVKTAFQNSLWKVFVLLPMKAALLLVKQGFAT
jgi:hypothetical protein